MRILYVLYRVLLVAAPILLLLSLLYYNEVFTVYHTNPSPEIISDMDYSGIDPQSSCYFFSDSSITRTPPDNTYPMYSDYYDLEQTEINSGESRNGTNPLPDSNEILAYGKSIYSAYCLPCHGLEGKGDGPVINKVVLAEGEEGIPAPPDFKSENTMSYSDARIFHVLSSGQNLMFPVSHKLSVNQRWAIIHYIHELQRK